jgi:hypothetical protein
MVDAVKPQLDPNVAQDLAALMRDLSHNPETRREVAKLVRKVKPDSPHAAAFKDVEIEDRFEAFRSEQEKKEIEREQRAIVDRMNGQRQRLLTGGDDGGGRKYSEDDVKKIEALMEKKGLTDYDDAAILYAATLPPTNTKPENQPTPQGATWEMPEFAEFAKDPNKAARSRAYQVIDEFRRKRA